MGEGLLEAITGKPAGLPPVLLLHGFGSSFEHGWRHPGWADLLAEAGRRVIGLDVLGHGEAPRHYEPDDYAGAEDAVAAEIADESRLDAIGFSLGGHIILTLAARDPERFRRIVIMGVGENLFRGDDFEPMARILEHGPSEEDILGRVFVGLAKSAGNDPRALAAFLRRPAVDLTPADLAAVTCPVLVLIGSEDFAGPPDPLVDALPNARLIVLEGIDHFRTPNDFGAMSAALDFIGGS